MESFRYKAAVDQMRGQCLELAHRKAMTRGQLGDIATMVDDG